MARFSKMGVRFLVFWVFLIVFNAGLLIMFPFASLVASVCLVIFMIVDILYWD